MLSQKFQDLLEGPFSFLLQKRLVVAVSAGVDSMTLANLCLKSSLNIAIAHCNFSLREKESDLDAQFVKDWGQQHTIPVFVKVFDTKTYANTEKISTQMAARDLRYNWFDALMKAENFDYLLTAHHANDALETLLINLGRGSGLKGLSGIPERNGKVVRPLLRFSRKHILEYAEVNQLKWREDRSNESTVYLRNALRHEVVPAYEKAIPQLLGSVQKTQDHLRQTEQLLAVYTAELRSTLMYPIHQLMGPTILCIDLEKLEHHEAPNAALYALLESYGFTAWEDVYGLRTAQSGKYIYSKTHRLLKDRTTLQLTSLTDDQFDDRYVINSPDDRIKGHFGSLTIVESTYEQATSKNEIFVDANRLHFPLEIRKWTSGDYFYPIGMKGKKKISKFLKDEKVSLTRKENVWLLCSNEAIVWVIGYRMDERFKVKNTKDPIVKIKYTYDQEEHL